MKKKAKYGIDGPNAFAIYMIITLIFILVSIIATMYSLKIKYLFILLSIIGILSCTIFIHTTKKGKFNIWNSIMDSIHFNNDINFIDLGCGQGAILSLIAKRLTKGSKGVGIDLWRNTDQLGNSLNRTKDNIKSEGLEDRIQLFTGNIMNLPFKDESFELVTSNLVIHNIGDKEGIKTALKEAHRVLKKDGQLIIADILCDIADYKNIIVELGMKEIVCKKAGVDGWWSGPWISTYILTAKK